MYEDQHEALKGIETLGLPGVFKRIYEGSGPARFVVQYAAPVRFFSEKNGRPFLENAIPLLEMNREAVYGYDERSGNFFEYFYGDEQPTLIGRSYQQLLGYIFVDLGYADLEDLVQEVSTDFEFTHLQELERFLEIDDDQTAEGAKKSFVSMLS